MADSALRELERAFLASRDPADEERWLLALVRAGELAPGDLAMVDLTCEVARPERSSVEVEWIDPPDLVEALSALRGQHPSIEWRWAGPSGLRLSGPSERLLQIGLTALRDRHAKLRGGGCAPARRRSLVRPVEVRARQARYTSCFDRFAEVTMVIAPRAEDDGLEVENRAPDLEPFLFRGVELGLRRACDDGLASGIPFAGITASVIRARTHPVDSTPRAFASAARMALEEAVERAGLLLEPWRDGERPMGRRPVDPATAAGLLRS